MQPTEAQVLKSIMEFFRYKNLPCYRMNSGVFQDNRTGSFIHGQAKGTADLCVGYPSIANVLLIGWIECKSLTGKLTVEQIAFLRKINTWGSPWLVAESVRDAELWLSDISYHGPVRHTAAVFDESRKFIPTWTGKRTKKLTSDVFWEEERWARKNISTGGA